jgi:hypothetical protein
MKKIKIPENADCWCTDFGALAYHVQIEDKKEFAEFCAKNNIGYHDGARQDIAVSESLGHIFTHSREVFENFPHAVVLMNYKTTMTDTLAAFNPRRYLVTQPGVNMPYFTDELQDIFADDVIVYDLLESRFLLDGEWFDVEIL